MAWTFHHEHETPLGTCRPRGCELLHASPEDSARSRQQPHLFNTTQKCQPHSRPWCWSCALSQVPGSENRRPHPCLLVAACCAWSRSCILVHATPLPGLVLPPTHASASPLSPSPSSFSLPWPQAQPRQSRPRRPHASQAWSIATIVHHVDAQQLRRCAEQSTRAQDARISGIPAHHWVPFRRAPSPACN